MSIEITPQQIRDAAVKVYREVNQEFSYRDVVRGWQPGGWGVEGGHTCRYVVPNTDSGMPLRKAGCIVGRILFYAGLPLADMNEMDNIGATGFMQELNRLGWWGSSAEHIELAHALQHAQAEQDKGAPWQVALREAGLVTNKMLKENV